MSGEFGILGPERGSRLYRSRRFLSAWQILIGPCDQCRKNASTVDHASQLFTYFPFRGFRFASGEFEHASDGAARFYRSFFRHPDLRLERFERPDDFVQRNCFHESAFGLGIDRVELTFRVELSETMQNSDFRTHGELRHAGLLKVVRHPLRGTIEGKSARRLNCG